MRDWLIALLFVAGCASPTQPDRVSRAGEVGVGRELETTPNRSTTTYLNFSITLSELQPYPRSDRQIQPGDYVATFVVHLL